jgi:hypothetical protein
MISLKCIKKGSYHITVGKIYHGELIITESVLVKGHKITSYLLKNDKGFEFFSEVENFIEIDKWRERQIDKILCN